MSGRSDRLGLVTWMVMGGGVKGELIVRGWAVNQW